MLILYIQTSYRSDIMTDQWWARISLITPPPRFTVDKWNSRMRLSPAPQRALLIAACSSIHHRCQSRSRSCTECTSLAGTRCLDAWTRSNNLHVGRYWGAPASDGEHFEDWVGKSEIHRSSLAVSHGKTVLCENIAWNEVEVNFQRALPMGNSCRIRDEK